MSKEVLELGHGITAIVEVGETDRAPYVPPKAEPQRRDPKNSHVWQTCICLDCAARRKADVAGLPGAPS